MTERRVLLGVSGSIAAYRAADLARDLMRAGCVVRVCLTDAAAEFVTPLLFETLTGQPVLQGVFQEPEPGRMAHIDWARWAELILVAPATASTISKLAYGIGDDMLTTIALASTAPLVIAPAMNPQMYSSDQVQASLKLLSSRAATVVSPTEGDVACGEHGQGKLASNSVIVESVLEILRAARLWSGKRILITSGPTQEPIDSVRFMSNRSSGKMGSALARAALLMGADVSVVSGPVSTPLPLGVETIRVSTALEMLSQASARAANADLIIGVAAVADFRPASATPGKIRRSEQSLSLELVENPDIIATLAHENPEKKVVGFAAEPEEGLDVVRGKVERKGLFAVAANNVGNLEIGFESDVNELNLVFADGRQEASGRRSKLGCALWLLEQLSGPAPASRNGTSRTTTQSG